MRGLLGCEGSKLFVGIGHIQLFVLLEVVQHANQQGSNHLVGQRQASARAVQAWSVKLVQVDDLPCRKGTRTVLQ